MSKLVEEYYNKSVEIEWTRMDRHPLEYEITKRHIDQFLKEKSRILDVGGGPGKYAFHYAKHGHNVTLLDLSPENVEFAKRKQNELGITLDNAIVGNAKRMDYFEDNSFDMILCMGPLYHLPKIEDRKSVISECKRIVKKDGIIVFSFITQMAQALSLLKRNIAKINEWEKALSLGIEKGINDIEFDKDFTEAYFIDPLEIEGFIKSNGLLIKKIAGAEGIACQSEQVLINSSQETLSKWIDFTFKYSEMKSTLGANQHIVCIATKE